MFYRLKTDFRLSIITLLGFCAMPGIMPFAVMRFMQGDLLAGFVDITILLGVFSSVIAAWMTGDTRRPGIALAAVICTGAVVVGHVSGEVALLWLFPCLITTFFLASPRVAIFLNVCSIIALMVVASAFSSPVAIWTFAASAVVTSACAFVFALRTENQRQRLEQLATIDPLTGVRNRRAMDEELEVAIAKAQRADKYPALVLLDVDHFKQVNDKYGHSVGDLVLVDLVALIEQHTRKYDQLFRYGGEEFVLLLMDVDLYGAKAALTNLQQVLHRHLRHPEGQVTASFGVAFLQPGEAATEWLERADAALYAAKHAGRDCVIYADPDPEQNETGASPAADPLTSAHR